MLFTKVWDGLRELIRMVEDPEASKVGKSLSPSDPLRQPLIEECRHSQAHVGLGQRDAGE